MSAVTSQGSSLYIPNPAFTGSGDPRPATPAIYSYAVLRYSDDAASGEALNIGVILYAPGVPFLAAKISTKIKRLSEAFTRFNSGQYRTTTARFRSGIERIRQTLVAQGSLDMDGEALERPKSLEAVIDRLWPDQELSYRAGPVRGGAAEDPREALDSLYERFVAVQYDRKNRQKRSDKDVWNNSFRDVLRREHIIDSLREKTFKVDDFDFTYEHAFKNGQWHVLQPVSLDYAEKSSIKEKAGQLIGDAVLLHQSSDELSTIYLLVGKPTDEENLPAYRSAVKLLERMPLRHEIVEEDEAEDFARRLADRMRRYGVLREDRNGNAGTPVAVGEPPDEP